MMRITPDIDDKEIALLIKNAKNITDDEIKSHLAKYVCIRISGYLENTIKLLIEKYHDKSCAKPTQNFIEFSFEKVTNLDKEKMSKILKSFSSDWEENFTSLMNDKYFSSLDSIIHLRNNIAHGKSMSVAGLTIERINEHYENLKEIVKILNQVIKKDDRTRIRGYE